MDLLAYTLRGSNMARFWPNMAATNIAAAGPTFTRALRVTAEQRRAARQLHASDADPLPGRHVVRRLRESVSDLRSFRRRIAANSDPLLRPRRQRRTGRHAPNLRRRPRAGPVVPQRRRLRNRPLWRSDTVEIPPTGCRHHRPVLPDGPGSPEPGPPLRGNARMAGRVRALAMDASPLRPAAPEARRLTARDG